MLKQLSIATVGTAIFSLGMPGIAQASGFQGTYDPSNWTLNNFQADGSVDTNNAPTSISLTGGDTGLFEIGSTSYTTTAASSGLVKFDWNYSNFDVLAFTDPFGFLLNGAFTQLTDDNGSLSQSGTYSTKVNQGDTFGFMIETQDNIGGAATVTVSNFVAPTPVPEPLTILGTAVVIGFGGLFQREYSKKLKKEKTTV